MTRETTAAVDSSFVGKRYKTRPYVVEGKQVRSDAGIPLVEDILFTSEQNTARDVEEKAWTDGAVARTMAAIRAKRDAALAATDWSALPDSPTMSSAMTTYRTALRDYPATYTANHLAVFPTIGE
jgi:hypothetical protein